MANKNDKRKSTEKSLEDVGRVAKKLAPTKAQRKKIYRKSGFSLAMPFISMFFALILAICFIIVHLFEADGGAGLVGDYVSIVFCGSLGKAAFLLPLFFGYVGILWCIFNIKWNPASLRGDEEKQKEYKKTRNRLILKTTMSALVVFITAVILGVFEDLSYLDIKDVWVSGSEDLSGGGLLGAPLAFLFTVAFEPVLSLIILFILLVICLMFATGFTPGYIIAQIKVHRELRDEDIEFESRYNEKQMEELRKKELEKVKKKRQKQFDAARRKEIRKQAEEEAELQPVIIPPVKPKRARTEKTVPANDESVDSLVSDIPDTNDTKTEHQEPAEEPVFEEPVLAENDGETVSPTPDLTEDKHETFGAETAVDYGGDSVIDGNGTVNLNDLLNEVGISAPEPEKSMEDIPLNEMSKDEISSDMAEVVPESGEEEETVITPYVFPPIDMLAPNQNPADTDRERELKDTANKLKQTLKSFKVEIEDIQYSRGPTITRYELKPAVGTRVRSIANLVDDIALNLASTGVRIEAPIPNKAAVGIEVPNRVRATVYLRDLIENSKFREAKSKLTACLGMDVGGNPIYFDISKMPHLLIAGATGMGKSVCINTIIISLLYKARPDDVKLILIDPKKVEFNIYKDIPHLYAPIVSDPKKAAGALASAVAEMERRFELIEEVGVRDITTYNAVTENDPEKERMPHMVIIIDELADLMMTAPDEVEACICRLAQKARAAGIHIIIGTQRPSVDVITGLIKANIPSRIACTVASQVDSRTIIDIAGAEKLIGRGDMLFAPVGAAKPMRVQGAFVSEAEVENIVSFIRENNTAARYNADFIQSMEENAKTCGMGKKGSGAMSSDAEAGGADDGGDSKFRDAVKLAVEEGKISTSLMQRRLGVGYGRAAKIIDTMEDLGYVSKPDGNKPRRVLITMQEYMTRVSEGTLGGNDE